MRRNPNTTVLTKSYIESKISQELIVSKYLNIPIEVVKHCIEYNSLIKSVFRDDDSDASMGIQYNNKGKLKVRDFGGYFFGDIYDVVGYVLSIIYNRKINVNIKTDFYFILKHIAYTFKNIIIENSEIDENHDNQLKFQIDKIKHKKPIIELVTRNWNNLDSKIWRKWGIDLNYLNTHFVYPIDQYYINRNINPEPKYYYSEKDPCYAYNLGINKKGIYNIKLYFPLRNKTIQSKFITNCNCLEGLPNLELDNYDYIIITKSTKDRLSIGCHIFNYSSLYGGLNIGIINLPHENYKLKQIEYDYLKMRLADNGIIISFMDNDRQGRFITKYLKDVYDIPFIFIPNGSCRSNNLGAKDFSELKEQYSDEVINEFIKEVINYLNYNYGSKIT